MRLLASGDHHFDEHSRFDECIRVHAWMVEQARDLKVDVFLSGGDVFERASTPKERQAVAEWLAAMAEVCPVVIAKGNHDRPLDVALMRRLKTKHPVTVEEGARVHYVAGAAIATMAWPERAPLLAALGSLGAADTGMREALQAVMRGLGQQLEQHDGPRIGLGHFMVDGSIASTGQPLLGMPINVSLTDLDLLSATLTAMGHIHMAQDFPLPSGGWACYTGSPFRTDFGQLESKGVLYAEFDGAELVDRCHIETPATPMVHIDARWDENAFYTDAFGGLMPGLSPLTHAIGRGAEVRFRFEVAADQQDAALAALPAYEATLRSLGAVSVKSERIVIATTRARAPEVAKAASLEDALRAHWASIGYEPGEAEEALLTKAAAVEEEVRLAS